MKPILTKPILFSTPMVQALLAGRKSQTRRIIKPQPEEYAEGKLRYSDKKHFIQTTIKDAADPFIGLPCPYQIGDVLWVRETFCIIQSGHSTPNSYTGGLIPLDPIYAYKADGHETPDDAARHTNLVSDTKGWHSENNKWKPSIFMPREAARIFLKVTDIKVERACDISEEDALAEGIESWDIQTAGGDDYQDYYKNYNIKTLADGLNAFYFTDPISSFKSLFESINGPDSWESWCWCISFTQIDK